LDTIRIINHQSSIIRSSEPTKRKTLFPNYPKLGTVPLFFRKRTMFGRLQPTLRMLAPVAALTATAAAASLDAESNPNKLKKNRIALCHGNHSAHSMGDSDQKRLQDLENTIEVMRAQLKAQFDVKQFTGQGNAVFSWESNLTDAFPSDAKSFERDMHGGFSEDVDTGIVYTGIPNYGLCKISPDLKTWTRIGKDERLKDNIHGICVYEDRGKKYIAMAQNEKQRVLITALDGTVLQELTIPKGGEFNFDEANGYYSSRTIKQLPWDQNKVPQFAVTDVAFLDGRLYCVTGYCPGDFVLTATFNVDAKKWEWGPIAWGGKDPLLGTGRSTPGKFQTAHGIFAHDNHIFVANREAHQVLEFTKDGRLVRTLPDIPNGARICNIAHAKDNNFFVINALAPITSTPEKTASIYAHSGERLLSEIQPGQLGIPVLKHLHHVHPHYIVDHNGERTLHLLIHGWSAGKFAVLKHEKDGKASEPNMWRRTGNEING